MVYLRHGDLAVLPFVVLEILDQGLFNDTIEFATCIKSQIAQFTHDFRIKGNTGTCSSFCSDSRAA